MLLCLSLGIYQLFGTALFAQISTFFLTSQLLEYSRKKEILGTTDVCRASGFSKSRHALFPVAAQISALGYLFCSNIYLFLKVLYIQNNRQEHPISFSASLQKSKRIVAWLSSLLLGIYHISAPGCLCLLKYRLSSQILIYPKQAGVNSCLSPSSSLQDRKRSVRWLSSLSLVIFQLRGIPLLKSLNCNLDFSDPQIRFLTPHVNL